MNWYLQLELPHEFRCRLPVPFVYVSWFHISWHWDPDALARWNTVIPTCRLVSRAGPMQRNFCWSAGLALGSCGGKARSRLK